MPPSDRIHPLDLFSKEEWRVLRERSSVLGLGLVAHAWGVIGISMALGAWQPWLIPLLVPVVGARQLGLAVLMHEGAHGGLSTHKGVNDVVGQWLCAAPVGANLALYRTYHLVHHKYTQQPEDPDLRLSEPFPISRESFRRKAWRDLTGQTFIAQYRRSKGSSLDVGADVLEVENRSEAVRQLVGPYVASNLALFAGLTALGVWWVYFALWLLPLATWYMFVLRLRNIAEHAVVPDNRDPMRHARTTRARWWERALIAPYAVNYHCEHHMFMNLPCYRLAAAHELLTKKGVTERMEVQEGYRVVLQAATSA